MSKICTLKINRYNIDTSKLDTPKNIDQFYIYQNIIKISILKYIQIKKYICIYIYIYIGNSYIKTICLKEEHKNIYIKNIFI